MILKDLKTGLHILRKALLEYGYEIETERWQGAIEHPAFLEILHADMQAQMYDNAEEASTELKASQPLFSLILRLNLRDSIGPNNKSSDIRETY